MPTFRYIDILLRFLPIITQPYLIFMLPEQQETNIFGLSIIMIVHIRNLGCDAHLSILGHFYQENGRGCQRAPKDLGS